MDHSPIAETIAAMAKQPTKVEPFLIETGMQSLIDGLRTQPMADLVTLYNVRKQMMAEAVLERSPGENDSLDNDHMRELVAMQILIGRKYLGEL
jgi:hypothetical protein